MDNLKTNIDIKITLRNIDDIYIGQYLIRHLTTI